METVAISVFGDVNDHNKLFADTRNYEHLCLGCPSAQTAHLSKYPEWDVPNEFF